MSTATTAFLAVTALAGLAGLAAFLWAAGSMPHPATGQAGEASASTIVLPFGLRGVTVPPGSVATSEARDGTVVPATATASPGASPTGARFTPTSTVPPTPASPSTPTVPIEGPLSAISARHLRLTLGETDPGASPRADAWWVDSPDDPAYGMPRSPVAVASRSRAAALIPQGWPFPAVVEYELLVELPSPMIAGHTYRLHGQGGSATSSLLHDPDRNLAAALHLNVVGYRPSAPHAEVPAGAPGAPEPTSRHVYMSAWLAGLPPLELGAGERTFAVVDAMSGNIAGQGELTLRRAHDEAGEDAYDANYAQANVYEGALGGLEPGAYYLRWEGVGRSHAFTVAETALDDAFAAVFRGLFHQRCGAALEPSLTDWPHAICHQAPVTLTTADVHVTGGDAFEALPAQATGEVVTATGGYHDAGDYDRRIDHLASVDALVDLFELVPWLAQRDDLGLPESGNGRADVLDEALWALDVYAQLQGDADQGAEDGGVPAGIETTGYPEWAMMPEDDTGTTWYAYAEDARSSYRFAGAAAKIARALAGDNPTLAAAWLERAVRAWTWAEAHPPDAYDAGALGAYAAAELFKSTGDEAYVQAVARHAPLVDDAAAALAPWDPGELMPALWALASSVSVDGDLSAETRARQVNARSAFLSRVDTLSTWAERSGNRWVKHPYAPVGYGSLTSPAQAAWVLRGRHLLAADDTTGRATLLSLGAHSLDAQLGANPSGRSWVTGLGETAVRRPLHNPSLGDGVDAPVPGIPVYGPSHQTESNGILASALGALRPPPAAWPPAERFVDVAYVPVYNEFTVAESMAPTIFVMGYLAGVGR